MGEFQIPNRCPLWPYPIYINAMLVSLCMFVSSTSFLYADLVVDTITSMAFVYDRRLLIIFFIKKNSYSSNGH